MTKLFRRSRALLLASVLFAACSAQDAEPPAPGNVTHGPQTRVIRVGMTVETPHMERRSESVRALVERYDGYVEQAGSATSDSAWFDVRIPAARVPAFRRSVARLGKLAAQSETVEDVGDTRADLEARLRNARREEERLLALLSERTGTLADVILVEERLAAVRERIEQLDTTRATLEQRIEYAQVHVSLAPPRTPFWRTPVATVSKAAAWGIDAASALAVGTAAIVVAAGPTFAMVAFALLALVLMIRTVRRRFA